MIYVFFILAVLLNGATDAANAITGVVCGGVVSYRWAAFFSAALNFAGLLIFAALFPAVSETVVGIASGGRDEALAVLLTIVIFAGAAWIFSVPTSESHALISALAGVALARGQGMDAVGLVYIMLGALLSALLGALLGAASSRLFGRVSRGKALLIVGCGASSFFHGAQDGQKFLALAVATGLLDFSIPSVMLVASVMFLGTLLGGRRIVRRLGEKMVHLSLPVALSSDIGSALSLFIITLLGIPASTTHTKTCAIAGAASFCGAGFDKKELCGIVFGWIITVPACILLAYFITKTINLA